MLSNFITYSSKTNVAFCNQLIKINKQFFLYMFTGTVINISTKGNGFDVCVFMKKSKIV